MRYSIALILSK